VHDLLILHPDTNDVEEDTRTGGCGGQTIFSNAMTGYWSEELWKRPRMGCYS